MAKPKTQDVFGNFDRDTGELQSLKQGNGLPPLALSELGTPAPKAQANAYVAQEILDLATAGAIVPGRVYVTTKGQCYLGVKASEFVALVVARYSGSAPSFGACLMPVGNFTDAMPADADQFHESIVLANGGLSVNVNFNLTGKINHATLVVSEYLSGLNAGDHAVGIGFRLGSGDFQTAMGYSPAIPFCSSVALNGNLSTVAPSTGVATVETALSAVVRGRTVGAASAPLLSASSAKAGDVPLDFGLGLADSIIEGELLIMARRYTTAPYAPGADIAIFRRQLLLTSDGTGAVSLKATSTVGTDFKAAALAALNAPTVAASGSTLAVTATGIAGVNLDWRAVFRCHALQFKAPLWPAP